MEKKITFIFNLMTRTSNKTPSHWCHTMPRDNNIIQQIKQLRLKMLILAAALVWYAKKYLDKKPRRDSTLPGHDNVQELLEGHPERFQQVCRMEKPVFIKLYEVLCERNLLNGTRVTTIEEQLIIF